MKTLVLSFVVLMVLLSQPINFATAASEPYVSTDDIFTDVEVGDPYYDAILWLKDEEIIGGYEDGSYKPDNYINRAEFSKILTEAAKKLFADWEMDSTDVELNFTDVPSTEWYRYYLIQLNLHDVVSGYPDGSFKPANNVNFAEAAKMIMIAYGSGELTSTGEWYEPYIEMLEGLGVTLESIQSNDQYITRGEMAQMIYQSAQNR